MLQNKFERPLDLAIKQSKIFYSYLFIIFLFALVSILITVSLSLSLRLLLVLLLMCSTFIILRKSLLENISHLRLNKDNDWEVLTFNNECFAVELFGECIVTSFLVWINLSTLPGIKPRKNFHVLLFSDSVDQDQFRQLRVRLRFFSTKDKVSEFEE